MESIGYIETEEEVQNPPAALSGDPSLIRRVRKSLEIAPRKWLEELLLEVLFEWCQSTAVTSLADELEKRHREWLGLGPDLRIDASDEVDDAE